MAKSYAFKLKSFNIKYSILSGFQKNKLLILSLSLFLIIGLLTGVLVAVKCGVSLATLTDFNLNIYVCSESSCFGDFCTRVFSCLINLLLLTIVSSSVFLVPVGYILIAYRAYLIGFNLALLACLYGITGALTSILVALPCQLAISLILIIYFTIAINRAVQKKKYGVSYIKMGKIFCIFLGILLVVCLIETILMAIFSAKAIFVI